MATLPTAKLLSGGRAILDSTAGRMELIQNWRRWRTQLRIYSPTTAKNSLISRVSNVLSLKNVSCMY